MIKKTIRRAVIF